MDASEIPRSMNPEPPLRKRPRLPLEEQASDLRKCWAFRLANGQTRGPLTIEQAQLLYKVGILNETAHVMHTLKSFRWEPLAGHEIWTQLQAHTPDPEPRVQPVPPLPPIMTPETIRPHVLAPQLPLPTHSDRIKDSRHRTLWRHLARVLQACKFALVTLLGLTLGDIARAVISPEHDHLLAVTLTFITIGVGLYFLRAGLCNLTPRQDG